MKNIFEPMAHQLLFETNGYSAEMCIEKESLGLAYHLRYKAYLNADAIEANPEEAFKDHYDQQKNVRTFLIWYEGQPVASVRSLTWSADYGWAPTDSIHLFEADIDKHCGMGAPLLESNRFVVDPAFTGRKSLTAQMLLFRIQTMGSIADNCDYVITAVRPRHVSFYQRFMGFYPISEPISVAKVSFPIQLLATPVSSREKLAQRSALAAFEPADLENYSKCLQIWNSK